MSRIFISYKRVDKDKVFKIKDQIEAALGEKCWIDIDGIESDAQFKNIIIRAINDCEVVLFMYSKTHSKIADFERDWTVRELSFASVKKKRIVFVNIDRSTLTDEFAFDYGTKQQIDACSNEAIEKLICDLRKWLNIANTQLEPPTVLTISTNQVPRSKKLKFYAMSLTLSVVFCIGWLRISGEHQDNQSLGNFAVFASSIIVTYLSCFFIDKSTVVSKYHILTSLSVISAFVFFSAYTCMAVSLSFIGIEHMSSNLPSVPFSIMATISVVMLMYTKKIGYGLLWISGLGLSVGSYWWLVHNIWTPIIMTILSIALMSVFTFILMLKKGGISLWKEM